MSDDFGLMLTVDDDSPHATTDLSRELNRIVATERATAPAEDGSKSMGALLSSLMVSGVLSATTIKAVASVVIAFVQRGAARKITLRDGDREFTITAPSRDTERALTDWLTAGRPGDSAQAEH